MKKIVILLLTSLTLTTACEDVLNKVPVNRYVADNYLINQNGMTGMLTAAYDALGFGGQYNGTLFWLGEVGADAVVSGPGETNADRLAFDRVNVSSLNIPLRDLWQNSYRSIQAANIVLLRSDEVEFSPAELRNVVKGQAAFIRALVYFNLVRVFGDVPLVLTETLTVENVNVARTPAQAVYQQIITDLQLAETNLPVTYSAPADRGRAHQGAAKGLLAKVLLTQGRWAEAAAKAQEVATNPAYSLLPNYADVFSIANENNAEALFEIQHTPPLDGGSFMMEAFTPTGTQQGGRNGLGLVAAGPTLMNAYETGDTRRTLYNQAGNAFWSTKFVDPAAPGGAPNSSRNNFPVLRLADVLLIHAEALNESAYGNAAAFESLNRVRRRAGLPALTLQTAPNQAAFRDAVLRERMLELAFEGHRWFDLVRTNRLESAMQTVGITVSAFRRLFPLPQRELDINASLTQNAGY